jgi:hypothetical protein
MPIKVKSAWNEVSSSSITHLNGKSTMLKRSMVRPFVGVGAPGGASTVFKN